MDERSLRLALWCANQELDARRSGKHPGVQPWNAELIRAIELELAVSASGQAEHDNMSLSDHDDELLSTAEAARLLRWHERTLRRRASDLGGRKTSAGWIFQASVIHDRVERLSNARDIA